MTLTLVVPDTLRKGISPRRSIPGSAIALTESAALRLLSRIQRAVAETPAFGKGSKTHGAIYRAGLKANPDPSLAAVNESALSFLCAITRESIQRADVQTLAAAEVLLHRADHDVCLLGVVAALRGLDVAIRALHASSFYGLTAGQGGWTTAVWLTTSSTLVERRFARWLPVRHAVCAAEEADYRRAVTLAHSLRAGDDLLERVPIAFVFPDEPWANEDLAASQAAGGQPTCGVLLSAASELGVVRAEMQRGLYWFPIYALDLAHVLPHADLLALCAQALATLLRKPKYGPLLKTPPRMMAQVIACMRTKEAAAALAQYASHPVLAPIVLGFFRDAPELASAASEGKGAPAVARVAGRAVPKESSPVGAAPSVLRDRPWRATGHKKPTLAKVSNVAQLGLELERIVLPTRMPRSSSLDRYEVRPMTEAERAAWRRETQQAMGKSSYACADYALIGGRKQAYVYLRVPDDDCLWAWNSGKAGLRGAPQELVARLGLAALPGFLLKNWIAWLGEYEGGDDHFFATMSFISPRVAPRIARVAARRKKYRRLALAWLAEHPVEAAYGLLPDAVGPGSEARDDAEAALLYLASRGQSSAILAAAARHGADVAAIVETLLARDPLAIQATIPKRPPFLRVAELPAVALRTGGVLDDGARDALVEMLQVSPPDPPYPGLALVRDACEPESLGAFALELVEQWLLGDAPGRHDWMLTATVHLPSPAAERRIAGLAREWARKNQAKAERACKALAAIHSDLTLMHLAHIADTTRFDALRRSTSALLLEAADACGMSLEELGDRTVPDLGLGPDGTLELRYGARSFVVTLDETLRPAVREGGDDARHPGSSRSLPRPTKADDAVAVKTARTRFAQLRADLEAIADRERRRMELALASERSWSSADFRERMVEHPLLRQLVKRLVWVEQGQDGARLFRVAEDGSLAEDADAVMTLGQDARVCLAHPAREGALLERWLRIFGDYEILQPFEQLARATYRSEPREREAAALQRAAGIVVPARKTLGILESRGFRREDAGYVSAFVRPLRGIDGTALVARLPFRPGFDIEGLAHAADQTTEPVALTSASGEPAVFGALGPVSFSELVRDVEALRAN